VIVRCGRLGAVPAEQTTMLLVVTIDRSHRLDPSSRGHVEALVCVAAR
jgi:hypothetical protein